MGISFATFVENTPVCQFLTQTRCVQAWLASVFKDVLNVSDINAIPIYASSDTHTKHLLAIFNHQPPKLSPQYLVTTGGLEVFLLLMLRPSSPSSPFLPPPSPSPASILIIFFQSLNLQELMLQQSVMKEELNWNTLPSNRQFPFSLDYQMKLISVNHQPMKILLSIPPKSLYELLEGISNRRFGSSIDKITSQLRDPLLVRILANSGEYSGEHLAVLRWCLLTTTVIQPQKLPGEDLLQLSSTDIGIHPHQTETILR